MEFGSVVLPERRRQVVVNEPWLRTVNFTTGIPDLSNFQIFCQKLSFLKSRGPWEVPPSCLASNKRISTVLNHASKYSKGELPAGLRQRAKGLLSYEQVPQTQDAPEGPRQRAQPVVLFDSQRTAFLLRFATSPTRQDSRRMPAAFSGRSFEGPTAA